MRRLAAAHELHGIDRPTSAGQGPHVNWRPPGCDNASAFAQARAAFNCVRGITVGERLEADDRSLATTIARRTPAIGTNFSCVLPAPSRWVADARRLDVTTGLGTPARRRTWPGSGPHFQARTVRRRAGPSRPCLARRLRSSRSCPQ